MRFVIFTIFVIGFTLKNSKSFFLYTTNYFPRMFQFSGCQVLREFRLLNPSRGYVHKDILQGARQKLYQPQQAWHLCKKFGVNLRIQFLVIFTGKFQAFS